MSEPLAFPDQSSFAGQVAANIRAEMARRSVTQKRVAQTLGLPQSAVSNRSRGQTPWTLNEIEAIARLLRTTTSELCAIRDSNPEPAGLEPAACAEVVSGISAQVIELAVARDNRLAVAS